jgi:type IV pilus assembly protein PilC
MIEHQQQLGDNRSPDKFNLRWRGLFWRSGPTWRATRLWISDPIFASRAALIQMLHLAFKERLELAPILEGLAAESNDTFAKQLRLLNQRLKQGTSLVAAIEQTPMLLSDDDALALRFATQTGTLDQTYRQLASFYRNPADVEHRLRSMAIYWFVLAVTIFVLVVFLATHILPTYLKIYSEFELRPHSELNALAGIVSFLQSKAFLLGIGAAIAMIGYFWFPLRQRIRHIISAYLIRPVSKPSRSHLFRLLSVALASGRPMSSSISTLAKYHHDRNMQQKLLLARNDMEQGKDVWQSLFDAGVLTRQEWTGLCSLPDPSSQSWLLEKMAVEKEFELRQQRNWAMALTNTAVLLAFGGIVLFICTALFGFNTNLVRALA